MNKFILETFEVRENYKLYLSYAKYGHKKVAYLCEKNITKWGFFETPFVSFWTSVRVLVTIVKGTNQKIHFLKFIALWAYQGIKNFNMNMW